MRLFCGLGTYTRFRGQTRVPPLANLVLLTRLAVVLVPAGCLPPRGGRPSRHPARGRGREYGGVRDSLSVPRAKKGGRVATALKRRFCSQIGQGFSGGVSLIRDACDLCDTFPLAYKLK